MQPDQYGTFLETVMNEFATTSFALILQRANGYMTAWAMTVDHEADLAGKEDMLWSLGQMVTEAAVERAWANYNPNPMQVLAMATEVWLGFSRESQQPAWDTLVGMGFEKSTEELTRLLKGYLNEEIWDEFRTFASDHWEIEYETGP